jgi:hypothetical protein
MSLTSSCSPLSLTSPYFSLLVLGMGAPGDHRTLCSAEMNGHRVEVMVSSKLNIADSIENAIEEKSLGENPPG